MTEVNNFEKSTRLKLRFESKKGTLSVEDLWDLPLIARNGGESLNEIAKSSNRKLKDSGEEDFVTQLSKPNEILQLKFDLVKHIIEVRLVERDLRSQEKDRKDQKQKIMDIIVEKRSEALKGQSLEDLEKMLADL